MTMQMWRNTKKQLQYTLLYQQIHAHHDVMMILIDHTPNIAMGYQFA
jgi:hypothetical protein